MPGPTFSHPHFRISALHTKMEHIFPRRLRLYLKGCGMAAPSLRGSEAP